MRLWRALHAIAGLLCLTTQVLGATKTIDVGPNGDLSFLDEESGTQTTTITAGDTVRWVWMSSGHSTTRADEPKTWDSGIQDVPFSFSQTFPDPGRYPYHCTPHQSLGMVGTVVVEPVGAPTTTTTTLPPQRCTDPRAVAEARAQVAAECDCGVAATHKAYVRCATHVLKAAIRAGTLPRSCRDSVTTCTAKSTCGRPGFATCCRTTAEGVQTCSIKRSAAACKRPRGGSACVGDQASCCDACGGATCPLPTTTTTRHPRRSTTSTTLQRESCFFDSDCRDANLCDGLPRCLAGICVAERPRLCPDGTPALWLGTATSFARSVNIAITACGGDTFFSGTLTCPPGFSPCFGGEITIFGTIVVSTDGVTIIFNPFGFADGSRCNFDGQVVGFTMGGDFRCFDSFGFILNAGTWSASRCP